MDKWEYKVVDFESPAIAKRDNSTSIEDCENELCIWGEQGWELVSVIPHGTKTKVFLKRQKS